MLITGKKTLIILILILAFEVKSKNYEGNKFLCADEVGPVIEFKLPKLKKNEKLNLNFKLFFGNDRKLFTIENGLLTKTASPIDYSYYFYKLEKLSKKNETEHFFDFFPPSTLMFKENLSMFKTLACWNN